MATSLQEGWARNGWQERLDRTLDILGDYDLLLLQAPIGFGKERTVERWHHLLAGSGRVVWRIDGRIPATGPPDLSPLPTRAAGQRWHDDPDTARAIVGGFNRGDDNGRVLILENLHDLDRDDLAFVLHHLAALPPTVNAILTCHDIPQRWTAPLVAGGQMRIVGQAQLTLDFDECVQRIQMLCSAEFPLPVLRHIFDVTDGWPVAIEYAAVHVLASADRMAAAAALPDIWPDLAHWMQDSVWEGLTEPDQTFLLGIAVLGDTPLDMACVRNIVGADGADGTIDRLRHHTPFFRVDERGRLSLRRVAMHFLRDVVLDCDRRLMLHREAARRVGSHPDHAAIGHILAAGDTTRASALLDEVLCDLVAAGEGHRARLWLDQVPHGGFRNAATLFAMALLGHAGPARSWVAAIEQREPPSGRETDHYRIVKTLLAAIDEDLDELGSQLAALDGANGLSGALKAAEQTLRLRHLQRLGQAQPFATTALDVGDSRKDARNFGFYCATAYVDATILLNLGQADAAVRLTTRVRHLALEQLGKDAIPTIELDAMLGAACLQAGQFDQALAIAKPWALRDLAGIGHSAFQMGHLTLARLAAHESRYPDALARLDLLDDIARARGLWAARAEIATATAQVAMMAGRMTVVSQAKANLHAILADAQCYGEQRRGLVRLHALGGLARIAAWERHWDEAMPLLEEAIDLAHAFHRDYERAGLVYLRQFCRQKVSGGDGEESEPLFAIAQADAATVRAAISVISERSNGSSALPPHPSQASGDEAIALTPKEREVIELMGRGFSKQLIAQALKISPETVKWHQKNIYIKFDIHDRHNVLAQARKMGLV